MKPRLIDTSLWIDFVRLRSPKSVKRWIAPFILDPDAHLAEPIAFEILRHASAVEARQIEQQFSTMPMLPTPKSLWHDATALGQLCRRRNLTVGSIDLVIAAIARHHGAEILTFDDDFRKIAGVSNLRVKVVARP